MAVSETVETLKLFISSNVSETTVCQKHYLSSTTIAELKGKLELVIGASATTVQLQLLNSEQQLVCELNDDLKTLESYNVRSGMTIHVVDKNPEKTRKLLDQSEVEKYEMSENDYAMRTDSVRAFKEKMKMGRFSDNNDEAAKQKLLEEEEEEQARGIAVGARCQVTISGASSRRGTVMFVGKTQFKPGHWIGVRYDEPLGKNDGSVQGHKYFECPPKYGAFVKPKSVEVGDFPEENFSDDEM